MERWKVLVWVALLLSTGAYAKTNFTGDQFRHWFVDAFHGKIRFSKSVQKKASDYEYIFVPGYNNENYRNYFQANATQLQALGVPPNQIHILRPKTTLSLEKNCSSIHHSILDATSEGRRVVLIGHSRGGAHVLAFALQNPEWVREHVHAIFLVQAALGGSGLVDYFLGTGPQPDGRMPVLSRIVAEVLGRYKAWEFSSTPMEVGFIELSRTNSREFWGKMRERYASAIPNISDKIFYVRSWIEPEKVNSLRSVSGSYLRAYYGLNDSTLALEDQWLPWVGRRLVTLSSEHCDLTLESPIGTANRRKRYALAAAIFQAVGQRDNE